MVLHGLQRCLLAFGVFWLVVNLTACVSMQGKKSSTHVIKPTASLSAAIITQLSLEGAEMGLVLKVNNPNSVPLIMLGFDYTVLMQGSRVTEGKYRSGLVIQAASSHEIDIPLSFRFAELSGAMKSLKNKATLDYEVKTTAILDLPDVGHYDIPMSIQGQLLMPRLPDVALQDSSE